MSTIPKAPNIAGLFLRFLTPGDLLFRLVPDDQYGKILGIELQKKIESNQGSLAPTESKLLRLARKRIQHVGIYAGHGNVVEVGGWKGRVKRGDVLEPGGKGRARYYDLVLRLPPRSKGQSIANKAEAVLSSGNVTGIYPLKDFKSIVKYSRDAATDRKAGPIYADPSSRLSDYDKSIGGKGSSALYAYQIGPQLYRRMRDEARIERINDGNGSQLARKMVCSHFVHAVLYSVLQGGHFQTAALKEFDRFFMISPSQLFRLAYEGTGIFRGHKVEFVVMHHDGKFIPWQRNDLEHLLKLIDEDAEYQSEPPSKRHPQKRKRWQQTQGQSREFATKSELQVIFDNF